MIWLYCIFGNEAQLMPYFLRHYAPLVDRLIMLDAVSDDGSADMVRACPNATLQPSAIGDTLDSLVVSRYSSEKVREARGQADFVLWVDCDEFLYSPIPLRELLRGYKAQGLRAIKATGWQMLADEFPTGDGQLTSIVRHGARDIEYDKMAIFDPALDVTWSPGHHNCKIGDAQIHQSLEIKLLHYRYFGDDYLKARNARNYAHIGAAEIKAGRGYQVYPGYESGKYSAAWYKQAQGAAIDVIEAKP
jgi:Glycosyl transferase family 2